MHILRRVVATVGTSLISNAHRRRASAGARINAAELEDSLAHTDAVKACAETNALHRIALSSDDKLVLVHSSTEEGALVAQVLAAHYSKAGIACRHRPVADLHCDAKAFEKPGLRNLVFVLAEEVRQAEREGAVHPGRKLRESAGTLPP